MDLFDTSADLGGNEIDISRFVRSDADRDVYVVWRDWEGRVPTAEIKEIDDSELCPAPIGDLPKIFWAWNAADGVWFRPESAHPGMTILLHTSDGKYTREFGWSPESTAAVTPVIVCTETVEPNDADRASFTKYRQTLEKHTNQVCEEMERLIEAVPDVGLDPYRNDLCAAARQHDWGKAHPVMQRTLHGGAEPPYKEILAKEGGTGRHSRPYFRHELASALAMIDSGVTDLAAYVVAAHHGRIRVAIRSMPGERTEGRDRVRGIKDDDRLLKCSLGDGREREDVALRLEATLLGCARDGTASWTERVLRLRDELGPFRLAYLEMLLRVADGAASARAEQEAAI
jgi:CRISPR-associated endonuclease/helicase Cas3